MAKDSDTSHSCGVLSDRSTAFRAGRSSSVNGNVAVVADDGDDACFAAVVVVVVVVLVVLSCCWWWWWWLAVSARRSRRNKAQGKHRSDTTAIP